MISVRFNISKIREDSTPKEDMMKNKNIKFILNKVIHYLDNLWSAVNQTPKNGKLQPPKETPLKRNHPWEKKKKHHPKNTPNDKIHNEWPLGAERTETKTFNKLRKQRQS
jgi:hypothetical protein